MRNTFILFGAVGALALGGVAQAQVLGGGVAGGLGTPVGGVTGGLTGQVTGPDIPTDRVTDTARGGVDTARKAAKRTREKAERTGERALGAADQATDASARAAGGFAAGTRVRGSDGSDVGAVVGTDASGAVSVRTKSGLISVPSSSLRMSGGAAVSSQSGAELRASAKARAD